MRSLPGHAPLKPARLAYSFASSAPTGVILRRGPTDWVRLIRWDTDHDTFTSGQWINARVPNFDISPSGRFLLTVVVNHSQPPHSWIALSRPPYFTALAVWQHPHLDGWSHCAFPEEGVIVVEQTFFKPELLPGFTLKEHRVLSRNEVVAKYGQPPFSPRRSPSRPQLDFESNEPVLCHQGQQRVLSKNDFIRPMLDQRDRLIFTRRDDGTLYAATIGDDLSLEPRALANFDNQTFEPIEAPDWATK